MLKFFFIFADIYIKLSLLISFNFNRLSVEKAANLIVVYMLKNYFIQHSQFKFIIEFVVMFTFFFLNINSYSRSIVSNIDGQNISLLNTNNTLIAETDLSLKAISANNYNNIVMVDSSLFCEGSAFSFATNITIDKAISVLKVSRMLQPIIISKDITAVARFVSYSRNFFLITSSYKYFIFFNLM